MKTAIWGSKEDPRECKLCGCTHALCSSTNRSGEHIVRSRVCSDCGRKFNTWEYAPEPLPDPAGDAPDNPKPKPKPKRKYVRKAGKK